MAADRSFTAAVVRYEPMTLLVPYDGSELATTALEKAAEYSDLMDEELVALTVVPDDDEYARERGWLLPDEAFDPRSVADRLGDRVEEVAPEATFRAEVVDSDEPTSTPTTNVVRTIRSTAGDLGASLVFIGSENAGSVTTPLSSVGGPVASDQHYDVYVVRRPE